MSAEAVIGTLWVIKKSALVRVKETGYTSKRGHSDLKINQLFIRLARIQSKNHIT